MGERNVGGLGEACLNTWAQQRGVTINKAQNDLGGWDHVLEWAPRQEPSRKLPLDRQATHLQCLVQVKGTDSRRRRRTVSLRNWMRLTESSLPVFYLILEFDGEPEYQRAFLRHHWKDDMEETLRRVRELDAAGEDWEGKSRSLVWSAEHAFPPKASEFFGRLESYIGSSLAEYATKKARLRKELGYEEFGASAKLQVVVPEQFQGRTPGELYRALALGLVPELRSAGGAVWDTRFGIQGREPLGKLAGGGVLSGPEGKPVAVELRSGSRSAQFQGKLFGFGGFGEEVELGESMLRIAIAFVDFMHDFGTGEGAVRLSLPGPEAWKDAREFADWGRAVLLLEGAEGQGSEVPIELRVEDIGPVRFRVPDLELPPHLVDVAMAAVGFWRILRRAEAEERGTVSVGLLMQQRQEIGRLDLLLSGGLPEGRLVVSVGEEAAEGLLKSEHFVAPSLHWVLSREVLVVFPVRHFGKGRFEEAGEQGENEASGCGVEVDAAGEAAELVTEAGQLVVEVRRSEVLEPLVVGVEEWPAPGRWGAMLEQAVQGLPDKYEVVKWW